MGWVGRKVRDSCSSQCTDEPTEFCDNFHKRVQIGGLAVINDLTV